MQERARMSLISTTRSGAFLSLSLSLSLFSLARSLVHPLRRPLSAEIPAAKRFQGQDKTFGRATRA